MIRHGRKPMSMTHGDFDYDYLERSPSTRAPAGGASTTSPSPGTSTR